jgi:hypothetical protein
MFAGCRAFISSNGLPNIATDYEPTSAAYKDLWEPILARVLFVNHTHKFDSKKDKALYNYIHICHLWAEWHDRW